MRPFAGLRFLWTDVEFESTSTKNTIPNLSNSSEHQSYTFDLDNDYWGIGFVAGIQPRFYFTPCFSLYAGLGVALVWGEFEMKRDHVLQSTVKSGSTAQLTLDEAYSSKSELSGMQSILDLELGLRYEMAFCDRSYLGYLEAGWEHHALLNHVSRQKLVDSNPSFTTERHDVVFGGFVLRVGFQF